MKKLMFLGAVIIIAVSLTGCGGGGGGDGGDDGGGAIDPNTSMIGVWQPVLATQDGTPVKVSAAMPAYGQTWTRAEYDFKQDGTCSVRGFEGSTLASTINGTWSSDNGVAPVTLNGVTTTITWGDFGSWMHQADFSAGGHNYHTEWVRIVDLTAHDPGLARTWKVTQLKKNGAASSIASFFGFSSGTNVMTFQYQPNGTMVQREVAGNTVVKRETGTWANGDSELLFAIQGGEQHRCIMEMGGQTLTFLDNEGNTIELTMGFWAPGMDHPAQLVGKWRATKVTQDGTQISMATFFGWEPGTTALETEFWSDGSVEGTNYAGTSVVEREFGNWGVVGTSLQINMIEQTVYQSYSASGSTMSVTTTMDGHTYVLTFTKVS